MANTRNGITNIEVAKIQAHPANPRKDLGDLTELTASIAAKGVLQNLTVVQNGDDTYTVIIGHRRLAAAKEAGLRTVPCVIAKMTEQEQIETMLVENMQRSDLTAYEQAQGFQMMFDFGESVESIADKTGFSPTTVRHRLKMAELDKEAFRQAVENEITFETLYKLEKIEDVSERNAILETFGTHDFGWKLSSALTKQENNRLKDEAIALMAEMGIPEYTGQSFYTDFHDWEVIAKQDGGVDWAEVRKKIESRAFEVPMYQVVAGQYFQLRVGDYQPHADDDEEAEREDERRRQAIEERKEALQSAAKTALNVRSAFMETFTEAACRKMTEDIAMGFQIAMDVDARAAWGTAWEKDHKKRLADIAENKTGSVKLMALAYLAFRDVDWVTWNYSGEFRALPDKYDLLVTWMKRIGYKPSAEEQALMDGTSDLYAKSEDDEDAEEE